MLAQRNFHIVNQAGAAQACGGQHDQILIACMGNGKAFRMTNFDIINRPTRRRQVAYRRLFQLGIGQIAAAQGFGDFIQFAEKARRLGTLVFI